ncbi:MAG: aa3-type cytochrome c oxidase subunit IV [Paracoccaceae bacterium]|jgi:hypothetical protein|nr:aa3-type cytochrome c oxidase subunit IV [Paracoccaceae bacterium]
MAEHKHGEMNSDDQERTFNGFISFTTRTAIVCIAVLVFLAVFNS